MEGVIIFLFSYFLGVVVRMMFVVVEVKFMVAGGH